MQTTFACARGKPLDPNSGGGGMAIYHLSVKTISRSAGRSATAAAAYRSGARIEDERTGEVHDYRRRSGVEAAGIVLPNDAPATFRDRAALWNAAEAAERRRNSTVAREIEIALPAELDAGQRKELVRDFALELVERHGCAVDVAIHAPGREGDHRNHHAHLLLTTRQVGADGIGAKTREWDSKQTGPALTREWRERYAQLQNRALERAGEAARVDHRSLEAQGIEREPTLHDGPARTQARRAEARSLRELIAKTDGQIHHLSAELATEQQRQREIEQVVGAMGRFTAPAPGPAPRPADPHAAERKRLEREHQQARQRLDAAQAEAERARQARPSPPGRDDAERAALAWRERDHREQLQARAALPWWRRMFAPKPQPLPPPDERELRDVSDGLHERWRALEAVKAVERAESHERAAKAAHERTSAELRALPPTPEKQAEQQRQRDQVRQQARQRDRGHGYDGPGM